MTGRAGLASACRHALIAAVLAGGFGSVTLAQSDGLAGSEWRPVEIDGVATGGEIPGDLQAFLQFRGDNLVAGHAGCNRFTGSYAADAGRLEFGPLATTRRACPAPVMEFEARFLDALGRVRGFARDRVDLVLVDADGTPVLRMAQTDAD